MTQTSKPDASVCPCCCTPPDAPADNDRPTTWQERAAAAGLSPSDGLRRYYVIPDAFGGYVADPNQRI